LLQNLDPSVTRFVTTQVRVSLPNQPAKFFTRDDMVGRDPVYLGCTISPIGSPAACLQTNDFSKVAESALRLTSSLPKGIISSYPFYVSDIQNCSALCANGVQCLKLGVKAAPLAIPFLSLFEVAEGTSGVIRKSDLLQKYGKSAADDKCGRGDIRVSAQTVENTGADSCEIPLLANSRTQLPSDMAVHLPRKVVADRISVEQAGFIKRQSKDDQIVTFANSDSSPAVGFVGDGGTDLTNAYGGMVRSTARLGNQLILANSNGCVSIQLR